MNQCDPFEVCILIIVRMASDHTQYLQIMFFTLCVLSVDMQNPLCAFHTLTVVSEEADITKLERIKTKF